MKLFYVMLIVLCNISCGETKPKADIDPFPAIEQKAKLYCELSKQDYERNKYVVDECDGAGFTSLYALACPDNGVDLSVFEAESGEMFRNPTHDCYPEKSKSGFSKDHVLMRLVAAIGQNDRTWPAKFFKYVEDNNGFFCDAVDAETRLSRCFLSPFLVEYINKALSNKQLTAESDDAWFEKSGFEAHLHVLGIWAKGKIDGSISNTDSTYLKAYAKREPLNALYQSVAYRYGQATKEDVLNAFSSDHWPSDRLPSTADHCSSYLFQRDMSSTNDWSPCPADERAWSGTDFSFAAYALTR